MIASYKYFILVTVLSSVIVFTITWAYALPWEIEVVDNSDSIRVMYNSIDVDDDGNIHFLYLDGDEVRYTIKADSGWIRTTPNIPGGSTYNDIIVDRNGESHAGFIYNGYLIYAHGVESLTDLELVFRNDSSAAIFASIALKPDDSPCFAFAEYIPGEDHKILYAFKQNNIWDKMVVASVSTSIPTPDLEFDSNGLPHVLYAGSSNELCIGVYNGSYWEVEQIYPYPIGSPPKLVIDDHDNIYAFWSLGIRYAKKIQGVWESDTLPWSGRIGFTGTWAADAIKDSLFIAFGDEATEVVHFANNNGGDWNFETVDSFPVRIPYGLSMAIDPEYGIHLSYPDIGGNGLYHAYRDYITSIDEEDGRGSVPLFEIKTTYPNPFNSQVTIEVVNNFEAGETCRVAIYNISGKLVDEIYHGELPYGTRRFQWSGNANAGREKASGVYFLKFEVQDYIETRKITLIQ